jgi:hypothetical protein
MGVVMLLGRRPASITRLRSSPCPRSIVVHFKSLLPITNALDQFIRTQFIAMQRLFAESRIAVLPGTTEDLSNNMALQPLLNLNVGQCKRDQTTQNQDALFANRNNVRSVPGAHGAVGYSELVVYIVQNLIGVANPIGCASHPRGRPGALSCQSALQIGW